MLESIKSCRIAKEILRIVNEASKPLTENELIELLATKRKIELLRLEEISCDFPSKFSRSDFEIGLTNLLKEGKVSLRSAGSEFCIGEGWSRHYRRAKRLFDKACARK